MTAWARTAERVEGVVVRGQDAQRLLEITARPRTHAWLSCKPQGSARQSPHERVVSGAQTNRAEASAQLRRAGALVAMQC